ncbi:MAG TPA: type II secretion system protein [Thermoanaerobaculia bacterium]|nr:type II secretion system protein [Thermoanaerobaculia bacterium]
MRCGKGRQKGFSLVEVLAALLILTLVITMSLAAFVERSKRQRQASEIILAYQALANEAEYRRRIDFAALDAAPSAFISDTALLAPLAPFTTAVAVQSTTPGVKNVTLTIRWSKSQRDAKLTLVRVDTGGTSLW